MANQNELIGPFRRNFRLLANGFGDSSLTVQSSYHNLKSWLDWIRDNIKIGKPTAEHGHYVLYEGAPLATVCLLRRRLIANTKEEYAATKHALTELLTVLDEACRADPSHTDAGVAFARALDPFQPLYLIGQVPGLGGKPWAELRGWPTPHGAQALSNAGGQGAGGAAVDAAAQAKLGPVIGGHPLRIGDSVKVAFVDLPFPSHTHFDSAAQQADGMEEEEASTASIGPQLPHGFIDENKFSIQQYEAWKELAAVTWLPGVVVGWGAFSESEVKVEVHVPQGMLITHNGPRNVCLWINEEFDNRLVRAGSLDDSSASSGTSSAPVVASATAALRAHMSAAELDWRSALEPGSICDFYDERLGWCASRVLDASDIVRGLPSPNGSFVCVRVDGLAHGFEQWLDRYSARLAPINVWSAGRKANGYFHSSPLAESPAERECSVSGPSWVSGVLDAPPVPNTLRSVQGLPDGFASNSRGEMNFRVRRYSATAGGRAVWATPNPLYVHVLQFVSVLFQRNEKEGVAIPILTALIDCPKGATAGKGSTPRPSFPTVVAFVESLGRIADALTVSDGHARIVGPALQAALDYLNTLTAEEVKDVTRESVATLLSGLCRLVHAKLPAGVEKAVGADGSLAKGTPLYKLYALCESVCVLGLAAACLRSEAVLRRREGLLILHDTWACLQAAECTPRGIQRIVNTRTGSIEYRCLPVLHTLDAASVAAHFSAAQSPAPGLKPRLTAPGLDLLQDVCVRRQHTEAVRQSGPLLLILASAGLLTSAAIEAVWSACWRTAEEDARAAVSMLSETVPLLPVQACAHLLELSLASGGTHWPVQTAALYEALACRPVGASAAPLAAASSSGAANPETGSSGAMQHRALAALYCLTVGISPLSMLHTPQAQVMSAVQALARSSGTAIKHEVSPVLAGHASDAFIRSLARSVGGSERATYARLCVLRIAQCLQASTHLSIFRRIVTEAFPKVVLAPAAAGVAGGSTVIPQRFDLSQSSSGRKGKGKRASPNSQQAQLAEAAKLLSSPAFQESVAAVLGSSSAGVTSKPTASQVPGTAPLSIAGSTVVTVQEAIASLQHDCDVLGVVHRFMTTVHKAGVEAARGMELNTWAQICETSSAQSSERDLVDQALQDLCIPLSHVHSERLSKQASLAPAFEALLPASQHVPGLPAESAQVHALSTMAQAQERVEDSVISCLSVLGLLVSSSHLSLSQPAMTEIWDEIVEQALTRKVRQTTLALFIRGVCGLAASAGPVGIHALQGQHGSASSSRSSASATGSEPVLTGADMDLSASASDTHDMVEEVSVQQLRLRGGTPTPPAMEPTPVGQLFTVDTAEYIFRRRIDTPAWASRAATSAMDLSAFTTWRTFFLFLSGRQGHVAYSGAKLLDTGAPSGSTEDMQSVLDAFAFPSPTAVLPFQPLGGLLGQAGLVSLTAEPTGVDTLWTIALCAQDPSVASAAVYLLTALQRRPVSKTGPSTSSGADSRRAYIQRALQYLNSALASHGSTVLPTRPLPVLTDRDTATVPAAAAAGHRESGTSSTMVRRPSGVTHVAPRSDGRPEQLLHRCVSLLKAVLDGAEDEAVEIQQRLLTCTWAASTLQNNGVQLSEAVIADLLRARAHVEHSPHAGGAADLFGVANPTTAATNVEAQATAALQVCPVNTLRIICVGLPQPQSSTAPSTIIDLATSDSSAAFKVDVPKTANNGDMFIRVHGEETARSFRARLCVALGVPTASVRVQVAGVYGGGTLGQPVTLHGDWLGHSIVSLQLKPDAAVTVLGLGANAAENVRLASAWADWCASLGEPAVLATELSKTVAEAEASPASLLAADAEAMYALLQVVQTACQAEDQTTWSPVASAAWSLLCRLPTTSSLTSWAVKGQSIPPGLWKALISSSNSADTRHSVTDVYCALFLRKLLLDGPLVGAALAQRVLKTGVADTNATDAATAAYAQHSLNEPAYALLLSSTTDLSVAVGLRPRLVEKAIITSSQWAQEGRTQPDKLQLSIDVYTHNVCTEVLPSFAASQGLSLLLDALQVGWSSSTDKASTSRDIINSTFGAVLLDIVRHLVQRSASSEVSTSSASWPRFDPAALRRVSAIVLGFLRTATAENAGSIDSSPTAALRTWCLLEGISLWSTCIQIQPSLWTDLVGNPSDSQALSSLLCSLLPTGGALGGRPGQMAYGGTGEHEVTVAGAAASALCRIARAIPGRESVEWLLQWCIRSRPRPDRVTGSAGPPTGGPGGANPSVNNSFPQLARDAIVSVHYALLDTLLRLYVLNARREGVYLRASGNEAAFRVLPGEGPPGGTSVDTAAVLPPRLHLPKELQGLLEELAADIRACPSRESSWHAALCMRTIESHPTWKATLEGTEASWEEPKQGLKRGYRTIEEMRLAHAIASARGDAATALCLGDALARAPAVSLAQANTNAIEQAREAVHAVSMEYAVQSASLYSLTSMDERFASLGVEPDARGVLDQFGLTVDLLVEGGMAGLQQAKRELKYKDANEYMPFVLGGPTTANSTHDGAQRGLAPLADLVTVLCPRPYDVLCTVAGVDTLLLGVLRAATVLMEADPVTAAQVCQTAGLVPYLYSDCLWGSTAMSAKPFALDHALVAEQEKLGRSGVGMEYASSGGIGPKCATLVTRRAAFGLLRAVIRRSPFASATLLQTMDKQALAHWHGPQPAVTYVHADSRLQLSSAELRSPEGYAGLRNMGCTCYMNSLMQQFFMCEPLRYGVLAVMDATDPAAYRLSTSVPELNGLISQRDKGFAKLQQSVACVLRKKVGVGKDGNAVFEESQGTRLPTDAEFRQRCMEERKECFLYQLQRIFAGLELTTRRAWNPHPWMAAYKDLDGQPTNPTVQQDAQEFLTTFLDRLEDSLADTPRAALVQSILGCSTREVRMCSGGCGTVTTNTDSAVCLSMPVAPGSLEAALSLEYEKWEEVTDYACEACKRKTTLRKRTTIDALSDTLIVHLKRFSMNYETGQPLKINTRFTFPASMDMHAYSYDALSGTMSAGAGAGVASGGTASAQPVHTMDKSRWQYALVGVVVHMGNLDSGHYYSYIKERGVRASVIALHREATKMGLQWSPGQPVPPELLAAASHGQRWFEFNDSIVSEWDITQVDDCCFGSSDESKPAVRSAYMLVYERMHPMSTNAATGVLTVPKANKSPAAHAAAIETDKVLRSALLGEKRLQKSGASDDSTSGTGSSQGNHKRARLGAADASPATHGIPPPHQAPVAIVPRDIHGCGPMPLSHLIEVQQDEYLFRHWSTGCDREMGGLLMLLADTVSRQATHMPLLAAKPCPLPPLPTSVPLLDGDECAAVAPVSPETLLRPLVTVGFTSFIRSLFGCERVPAPNAVTFMHLLCRIIGSRRDAARVLLQDIHAAESFNAVQHMTQVQLAANAREEDTPLADLALPKLSGRLCHAGLVFYGNPREERGWWRAILFGAMPPMARLATGKLFATAFLRLALPVAELLQWQSLWVPGNPLEMEHEDLAKVGARLCGDAAFKPGTGALAEHMADAQMLTSLAGNLAKQDIFDQICFRWLTVEAYWACWWDICRGGFGCGLPLPLSSPTVSGQVEPAVLISAYDDNTSALVASQAAPVLAARLQASRLWAKGVTQASALTPRAARVEGVPVVEKGTEAFSGPDTVYRAAAVATHALRISLAEGRADLRAVLLQYLLQLGPDEYDRLSLPDEPDQTRPADAMAMTRLARLVACPGTLPKVPKATFQSKTTMMTASLRVAYELYSLLARSVAPDAGHDAENCAPIPFTTVGITPQPAPLQAPSVLIDMLLQAAAAASDGSADTPSPTSTTRLAALCQKVSQPMSASSSSGEASMVEGWDVIELWARYNRLKECSSWTAAVHVMPELEDVVKRNPDVAANCETAIPSFALALPVEKGGLAGVARGSSRMHTPPCAADVDLICRSQARASFLHLAHNGFEDRMAADVLPILWDWYAEYALYNGRLAAHILPSPSTGGKSYKKPEDALSWRNQPKGSQGATSARLLESFLPGSTLSSRGLALACPATVYQDVFVQTLASAKADTFTAALIRLVRALNAQGQEHLGESSEGFLPSPQARARLLFCCDRVLHDLTIGNAHGEFSPSADEDGDGDDHTVEPFTVIPPDTSFGWSAESVALSLLHSVSGDWQVLKDWPSSTPCARDVKHDQLSTSLLRVLSDSFDPHTSSNDEMRAHACTLCELVLQQPFPSRVLTLACMTMAEGLLQHEEQLQAARAAQVKKLKQGAKLLESANYRYQTVWVLALRLCLICPDVAWQWFLRRYFKVYPISTHGNTRSDWLEVSQEHVEEDLWAAVTAGLLADGHSVEGMDGGAPWASAQQAGLTVAGAGAGKDAKAAALPVLPAWAVAAVDPGNAFLLFPPSLMPTAADIEASLLANPAARRKSVLLSMLAVGPITALTPREEALALDELQPTYAMRALICLARLHRVLTALYSPTLQAAWEAPQAGAARTGSTSRRQAAASSARGARQAEVGEGLVGFESHLSSLHAEEPELVR